MESYDFTIVRCGDAREDGHDPRFRLSNTAMSLICRLLEQQDVLDWEDAGPLTLGALSGERLKVPAVKFESNNAWEVFPLETTRIAVALRDTSPEAAEAAVAQDHEEAKAKGVSADWGDPPVEDLVGTAQAFADFNALSSRYGGYRVG